MKFERPRIGMPLSKSEKVLESIGALIVLLYFLKLVMVWDSLPKFMVLDFSFFGNVDLFGSKDYLMMLGIVLAILYGILTFCSFKPCCFYYFITVTEKNARGVYKITRVFLEVLKIEVAAGFVYNEMMLIASTKVGPIHTGAFGHIIVWGSVIATIVVYFFLIYKFYGKNIN